MFAFLFIIFFFWLCCSPKNIINYLKYSKRLLLLCVFSVHCVRFVSRSLVKDSFKTSTVPSTTHSCMNIMKGFIQKIIKASKMIIIILKHMCCCCRIVAVLFFYLKIIRILGTFLKHKNIVKKMS